MLFHLLAYGGRGDEALALAANVGGRPSVLPEEDLELSLSATRALVSGRAADVDAAVKVQLEGARRGVGLAESGLQWLSALGRLDDAFAVAQGLYFDEGFSLGSQRYSAAAGRFALARSRATYPLFLPSTIALRGDPRFARVVKGVGLTDYWRLPGRGPDDPAWARSLA